MIDHETTACQRDRAQEAPSRVATGAERVRLAQRIVDFVVAGTYPQGTLDTVAAAATAVSLAAMFLADLNEAQVQAMMEGP